MEKIRDFFDDVHLYKNKIEYLVKITIWWISWIGGINATSSHIDGLSGACFIFALSLLMEFGAQIVKKHMLLSRILHTTYCLAVVAILLLSATNLFASNCDTDYSMILYNISLGVMIYMSIDVFVLWISPGDNSTENEKSNVDEEKLKMIEETLKVFEEKLNAGNIGNVK